MPKNAPPNILSKKDVIKALSDYCDKFRTQKDAAESMGTTPQSLSAMLADKRRPTEAVLASIGVHRALLYSSNKIDGRYLDGAMADF